MKVKLFVFLSLIILCLAGCDYYDDRLIVYNYSPENIYVSVSNDTILSLGENNTFMFEDDYVKQNTKKNLLLIGSTKAWEFFAEKSLNKELHVFILSEDTLKKYNANTIIGMKKYEKRIDIGIKDLEDNNWEVVYE